MGKIQPKEVYEEGTDLLQNMHWLIGLRWLFVAAIIVTVLFCKYFLTLGAAYFQIGILTAVLLAYNISFAVGGRFFYRQPQLSSKQIDLVRGSLFTQITLDLIILTLMIHYTGGGENPLLFFYIFHVTIAGIMFPRRTAYLFSLLAVVLLGFLLGSEYFGVISHYHLKGFLPVELYREGTYILGLGVTLTLTLMTSVYLATTIMTRLHRRELELEQARQTLLEESRSCEISLAQLDRLHKEKSDFMRKVAHELRAPLAAIKSCLQVAREYYADELTGKPREMIERAERRSDGLMALVKDLLNLSQATEFSPATNFQPLQIDKLLSTVIEFCRPIAQEQGIQIVAQLETTVEVMADPQGLEEVFTNLLSNAIKYSPEKTEVTVSLKVDDERACIYFTDQGIGIDPEDMPLLFTEFFRAKNAKALHVEGTGLGLALSKRIVEAHGGEISVESTLGEGSSFKLQLPLKPA